MNNYIFDIIIGSSHLLNVPNRYLKVKINQQYFWFDIRFCFSGVIGSVVNNIYTNWFSIWKNGFAFISVYIGIVQGFFIFIMLCIFFNR